MIDRAGQLWDYRPAESMSWARIVVLRSNLKGTTVFHRVIYVDNHREGDLLENLEHESHYRWENRPQFFQRIA